ncbi:hypothetical protein IDJ77_17860 [Mucilaginibacter sp. ZT4R22]|uniref:Uncharacterized protein n=1 Tax=Mucilaginibacter pankratovii TaxID=2772110 RepID=A0ABR7WTP9_9SPHI|nr:hypothetical protein [Mucilaginibacter pankratovii]MBD1365686.1 hypothetical protein [Mucilaginibacter pankratovii]
MKKVIYALILPLVVVSGLVFANSAIKNDAARKPLSAAESKAAHRDDKKKWEASPDGLRYKKWETSPDGIKAHASADKIRKHIKDFSNMEGVITSISRPSGSVGGFGMLVKINDDEYIVNYWPEKSDKDVTKYNNDLRQLNSLKVNDKVIIRSHSAGYLGKGHNVVLAGDYIERDNKVIFKRDPRKGGC